MLFYLYLCNLLEFNLHLTGDPRSTETANDNSCTLYYPYFQLSNLRLTLPTPFRTVILAFLLLCLSIIQPNCLFPQEDGIMLEFLLYLLYFMLHMLVLHNFEMKTVNFRLTYFSMLFCVYLGVSVFVLSIVLSYYFYPTALKGCRGIVFTHDVRMGGRREIVCSGCISETVRCRKFILGRDIGWGV